MSIPNTYPYKVSVVVPVYNVEDYLSETIESLLNQTLKEVELVLVNDGSTDRSEEIIKAFLQNHDSIVYVKKENSGPSDSRNKGLDQSSGEFVCFVDSDDILPLDALETMYKTAVTENADLVIGASISFNSHKTWYIQSHANHGVYNPGPKSLVTHPELLYSLGPCNKLFKKELVQSLRFPTGIKVTEDHPFVIEAYLKAQRIVVTDHVIYKYRRRETENNASLSQRIYFNAPNVLKDFLTSIRVSEPLWSRYLTDLGHRHYLQAYYYNRLIISDIWPAVMKLLKNKNEQKNQDVFNEITAWAVKLDPAILTAIGKMASRTKLLALQKAANPSSFTPIESQVLKDRSRKLINIAKNLAKNLIGYKVVYPMLKKKKIQDKLVYVSNKTTKLSSDSSNQLFQAFEKHWPSYELKLWLQTSKSIKGYFNYLNDLATAKFIVIDDYSNPFRFITKRSETELLERKALISEDSGRSTDN